MSAYTPVYRVGNGGSVLSQKQKSRNITDEEVVQESSGDGSSESDHVYRPVDSKDPYLVAGHSRGRPLPQYPFPHAAIKEKSETKESIQRQLFSLNPPVHTFEHKQDIQVPKHQHVDNLTTLLHSCVHKHDWQRASKILGLLLRTSIQGFPMDLRSHDHWALAAEVLMHRRDHPNDEDDLEGEEELRALQETRRYYERLILQYPYTYRSHHKVNAVKIYPMLFNIWVYEVQQRSKLIRASQIDRQDRNPNVHLRSRTMAESQILEQELVEANTIFTRLNELLLSPPYDTNTPLMSMKTMVELWIADLQRLVSEADIEAGVHQAKGHTDTSMLIEAT